MKDMKLEEAVQTLCKALREDKDYYISWQANIAMAYKDMMVWENKYNNVAPDGVEYATMDREDTHIVANKAATWFLELLTKEK